MKAAAAVVADLEEVDKATVGSPGSDRGVELQAFGIRQRSLHPDLLLLWIADRKENCRTKVVLRKKDKKVDHLQLEDREKVQLEDRGKMKEKTLRLELHHRIQDWESHKERSVEEKKDIRFVEDKAKLLVEDNPSKLSCSTFDDLHKTRLDLVEREPKHDPSLFGIDVSVWQMSLPFSFSLWPFCSVCRLEARQIDRKKNRFHPTTTSRRVDLRSIRFQ